jgi:hypothetical protein
MSTGPGNNPPFDGALALTLNNLQTQITALQNQVKPITVFAEVPTEQFLGPGALGPADLATPGPIVTATILASGKALVTVAAQIALPGIAVAVVSGGVDLWVDGAPWPGGAAALFISVSTGAGTAVGVIQTSETTLAVAGLVDASGNPGGVHTFELKYRCNVPSSNVGFQSRVLTVQPL